MNTAFEALNFDPKINQCLLCWNELMSVVALCHEFICPQKMHCMQSTHHKHEPIMRRLHECEFVSYCQVHKSDRPFCVVLCGENVSAIKRHVRIVGVYNINTHFKHYIFRCLDGVNYLYKFEYKSELKVQHYISLAPIRMDYFRVE